MATLQSPGVSVSLVDESIYPAAGGGTVPLFIVAGHKNKKNSNGDIHVGTLESESNKLRLITSRNELISVYGKPFFEVNNGTVNHGSEIAEYGLHGAWRALDQSNRAYVLMSDIDLSQLKPSSTPPSAPVEAGVHWMGLSNTHFGVFKAKGDVWESITPKIIDDVTQMQLDGDTHIMRPKNVIGMPGDYALVVVHEDTDNDNEANQVRMSVWEKVGRDWLLVGSEQWRLSSTASFKFAEFEPKNPNDGDVYVRTKESRQGAYISMASYNDVLESFEQKSAPLFKSADQARDHYVKTGALYEGQVFVSVSDSNIGADDEVATFMFKRLQNDGTETVGVAANAFPDANASFTVTFNVPQVGPEVEIVTPDTGSDAVVDLETFIAFAQPDLAKLNIAATIDEDKLVLTQLDGYEVAITGDVEKIGFELNDKRNTQALITNWGPLVHDVSYDEPVTEAEVGTLWYDDTMHMTAYKNVDGAGDWQEQDITIRSDEPTNPTEGDLWLDSNAPTYPTMYIFEKDVWKQIDIANEEVIVFDNFTNRSSRDSMVDLIFVDMDKSGMTVKERQANGEWVCVSGNAPDGTPYMGAKAQRQMVVRSLKSAVANSQEARANDKYFNLITANGYPELLPELNSLNVARKQTAFVVGSTPMSLRDSANYIQNWATNQNGAFQDGEDGLVTFNNMSAVWAFAGLQSDVDGNLVSVPADVMAMDVLLQNDRIAYPWFAPAGDTRGLVQGTSAIGFVDRGEFQVARVEDGILDTLYVNNVNPIINFPNEGIKVWGQKTLTSVPSAMDRINVSRLVAYLRYMLDQITRPFLFEQNDSQTRQAVLNVVERFLADIVQKRGITDFVVMCDESNNTPARIDRNELWVDISVVPTKSVEFIYVPIRLKSTGSI